MIKLILTGALFMLTPADGEWVTARGERVTKPCESDFVNQRMRMPRGCVAPQAGVLLTRDYFKALELDKVERDKLLEGKDEIIKSLEGRVRELEAKMRITAVESDEKPITPLVPLSLGVGLGLVGCTMARLGGLR